MSFREIIARILRRPPKCEVQGCGDEPVVTQIDGLNVCAGCRDMFARFRTVVGPTA